MDRNGWTLWSFQYGTPETLDNWHRELLAARGPVLVFCSKGRAAVDPDREGSDVETIDCRHYKLVGQDEWKQVPPLIRVPHPFNRGSLLRQRLSFAVSTTPSKNLNVQKPDGSKAAVGVTKYQLDRNISSDREERSRCPMSARSSNSKSSRGWKAIKARWLPVLMAQR